MNKCYNTAMKLVDIKHVALKKKSKKVAKIDKKTKELICEMKKTLISQSDPEGVGLAAPQVGKNLQIFIMHYPEENVRLKVIINPKVISKSKQVLKNKGKTNNILEGCLSLPYYYGPIERAKHIIIEYLSEDGKKVTEKFTGFAAQIVQHEIDHLNGRLFIDHIIEHKSPLYYIRGDEWEEVEL